jgi:hypothetical protein
MRVCAKMETLWDGKEVTNELHLQLHCIYTNVNEKPIQLSSVLLPFPVYGQHIFSPSQPFPSFQRDVSLTGWQHSAANPESHVCVCRKPLCLCIFFDLLNLFRPFWEMFRERQDNTVIHASHMGNYMLHAQGSETLQTYTFRLPKGKKELQWHFKQTVTLQFRYTSLLPY